MQTTNTGDTRSSKTAQDLSPPQEKCLGNLPFPDKLYGRQRQLATLATTYTLARAGQPALTLVSGCSGVGKTALVQEARRTVFTDKTLFICGKFDQYQRNTPCNGILDACKHLVRQLLDSQDHDRLRRQIMAATAPHGQLLVDVIPELEVLIGQQPVLPELPPAESENRFQQVFKKFISHFAQPDKPLIIFLDDLQWADLASLKLLQTLLTDNQKRYFSLVGAYRDNEVAATHPLLQTIDELKAAQSPLHSITLPPLTENDLCQWCMEILHCDRQQAQPLSRLLLTKTDGTPFFVRQFLLFCHHAQLLYHDAGQGTWQWDLDNIAQCAVTDNVADFMARRLDTLRPATGDLLSIAACIGNHFDTNLLTSVSGLDREETMTALCEALIEKLIALAPPPDRNSQTDTTPLGLHCIFLHDRIQQAAYARLNETQRSRLHQQIGNHLLSQWDKEENSGDIFPIVNQLNAGAAHIEEQAQRLRLASFNLVAGDKAKAAAAYNAAAQYLTAGLQVLPPAITKETYTLQFDLRLGLAECDYLNGDFAKAEQAFDNLLSKTQSPMAQAKAYKTKVVLCEHRGDPRQSLQCAITGLRLLGFEIPTTMLWWQIIKQLLPLKYMLRNKGLDRLQNLEPMHDQKRIMAMDILHKAIPAAYFLDTRLVILLSLLMSAMSLRHGHTNSTPVAFATLGVIWGSFLGDYRNGARIGEIARELCQYPDYREVRCKTNFIVGNYIASWSAGSRQALELMRTGVREGVASGETTHLTYSAVNEVLVRFSSGAPLPAVLNNYREYSEIFTGSRYYEMTSIAHALKRNIEKLIAAEWDGIDASSAAHDEKEYLARIEPQEIRTTLYLFYFHKMVFYTIFNHYDLARQTGARIVRDVEEVLFGSPQTAYFLLYYGLSITRGFADLPPHRRAWYLVALRRYQRKMRKWAADCPGNFHHQSLLLEAEIARITGRITTAATLYEKAIAAAGESGFLHHAGLANELAAMMHLANNNETVARHSLAAALSAYQEWGAQAKVNQLKKKFPDLT